MPFAKPAAPSTDAVENVAFACGPIRCWWRPSYDYAAPLYAAPVYVAPPVYVPAYVIPYTSGSGWYGRWRQPGWHGGWWGRRWY